MNQQDTNKILLVSNELTWMDCSLKHCFCIALTMLPLWTLDPQHYATCIDHRPLSLPWQCHHIRGAGATVIKT
jgi:hypothetical protein